MITNGERTRCIDCNQEVPVAITMAGARCPHGYSHRLICYEWSRGCREGYGVLHVCNPQVIDNILANEPAMSRLTDELLKRIRYHL